MRDLSTALPSQQPSVVIADDSAVAREGLVAIIRRDLGYTVCGLATDERATRELTEKHQPDLLVIEPFLGHHDGIFLLKQLAARFPRARILAVSKQPEEIYAERALRAGASGYWMKTITREELIRAIGNILAGELYVSPRIALRAVHEVVNRPATHPKIPNLTDHELHVFALSGAGPEPAGSHKNSGLVLEPLKPITNTSSSSWATATLTRFAVAPREWFELNHR